MSNVELSLETAFSNVQIPAGASQSYSVVGGSPQDYFSFSVSANSPAVLTITGGWYGNDQYQGPGCLVTNTGTESTVFDLLLFAVSNSGTESAEKKVVRLA